MAKHRLAQPGEYYIVTVGLSQYVARIDEVHTDGGWTGESQHPRTSQHDAFVGTGRLVLGGPEHLTEKVK
jgi:hypothetical protein